MTALQRLASSYLSRAGVEVWRPKGENPWDTVAPVGEPGPYQVFVHGAGSASWSPSHWWPPAPSASVPVMLLAYHSSVSKTVLCHQAPQELALTPKSYSSRS